MSSAGHDDSAESGVGSGPAKPGLHRAEDRDASGPQSWRRSWSQAAVVWAATHLVFAIATVLHQTLDPGWPQGLLAWRQWDAWSFERIATDGYGLVEGDTAFFPLYPLLAHLADVLLPGDVVTALLVLSNVAGLGVLVLLHRLLAVEAGTVVADRTIFVFGVFPTAYFLAAPYNHSLFLLLTLGFLYALRRETWWLAAVLGALASATRSVGVLLVLPFAYEYLRVRGFRLRAVRPSAAWLLAIPAGLVAFALYCQSRVGDPLAFVHSQAISSWDRGLSWPGKVLWDAVARLGQGPLTGNVPLIFDLAGTLLGVVLLIGCLWGPWALRRDQWVLAVAAAPILLLPLFVPSGRDNPVLSNARLLLDSAVLFVVLGRALSRPALERLYLAGALGLQFGLTLLFLSGDWTF